MSDQEPNTQQPAPPDAGANGGFSQEQVNQIVAERAKRAEEAAVKKLLESFGVQTPDEIKAVLDAKKQADDLAKTELEKAAERATSAEAKAAKLEQDHLTLIAQMQKRIMDSEIKQLAGRAVTDKEGKVIRAAFRPEALDDILLLVDRTVIEDKDGQYIGIDKALESLAKAKSYLLSDGQIAQQQKGTPKPGERKPAQQQQSGKPAPTFTL